jgi:hypothetical protein
MGERDLVVAVKHLIEESNPNGCLMIVVAFSLIGVHLKWMIEQAEKAPKKHFPKDISGFIDFHSRLLIEETEEIAIRRSHWFAVAGLVNKITEVCVKNEYHEDSAVIWNCLASSGRIAEHALKDNIVWSRLEKSSFNHVHDEKSGVSYILNHIMPAPMRRNRLVNKFANERDIFLRL